jgi:hypothetical protein
VRANNEASSEPVEGYFSLRGGEFTDAGSCATEIKSALAGLGISPETMRRAAVAAFEAEMNVIIHAIAGTLSYEVRGGELTAGGIHHRPGMGAGEGLGKRPGASQHREEL